MYLSYYNFHSKPFQEKTATNSLWLNKRTKQALASFHNGILNNTGMLLLTGDVGTGKTTFINALINSFQDEITIGTVLNPGLNRLEFLNYIANTFRIHKEFAGRKDFYFYFKKFLINLSLSNKNVLLVVDEAQKLSNDLLKDIQILSCLKNQGVKLINILLVGKSTFNTVLFQAEHSELRQKITLTYNIEALTKAETKNYIQHHLRIAGTNKKIFNSKAIHEIFSFSKGVPRLINVICDLALLKGFSEGTETIRKNNIKACEKELLLPNLKKKKHGKIREAEEEFNSWILHEKSARVVGRKPAYGILLTVLIVVAFGVKYVVPQEQAGWQANLVDQVVKLVDRIKHMLPLHKEADQPESNRPAAVLSEQTDSLAEKPLISSESSLHLIAQAANKASGPVTPLEKPPKTPNKETQDQQTEIVSSENTPKPPASSFTIRTDSPATMEHEKTAGKAPGKNPKEAAPLKDPRHEAGRQPITPQPATEEIALMQEKTPKPPAAVITIRSNSRKRKPKRQWRNNLYSTDMHPIKTDTVKALLANLREGPTKQSAVIGHLAQGDTISMIRQKNNWYFVKLPNGKLGWMHTSLFAKTKVSPSKARKSASPPVQSDMRLEGEQYKPIKQFQEVALRGDAAEAARTSPLPSDDINKADDPEASAWTQKSYKNMARRRFAEAIEAATNAISHNPWFVNAYINRAWAYCETMLYDKAISDCNTALKIDPLNALAYNNRGLAYQRNGEMHKAAEDYRKACDLELEVACENYRKITTNRLDADHEKKDYSVPALEWTQKSYENMIQEKFSEAIEAATKAISLDPGLLNPYINRAWAYSETGLYGKAISDCNIALKIDPNSSLAYNNRGLAYYRKGERNKAEKDYKKACGLGLEVACDNYKDLN